MSPSCLTRVLSAFAAYAALALLAFPQCVFAQLESNERERHFRQEVVPILRARCLSCHNAGDPKGGLSFSDRSEFLSAGVIEPGDPRASLLMNQITPEDGLAPMPKDADPLTAEEQAVIETWIEEGAVWGETFRIEPQLDFDWWSYKAPAQTPIPALKDPWVRTPIDAFVLRKMKQQGLSPSKPADRRTLIRRVTYDLTGLPPTFAEVEAFARDTTPNAYEELVERLLASPQYGERWARHWLDVVKYADTCGYDKDKLRPNAWPYRDYVIRSFNTDKPYSKFVQEQVAGDALFPGEPAGILGLGFLAAGPWDFIGHVEVPESKIDGKVARNLDRDDMVGNTLNTFCSLTVQCARCHDHKFDPILQDHYYALQNVFAAVDRADRIYDQDPDVIRKRQALQEELEAARRSLAELERERRELGGPELANLDKSIAGLQESLEVIRPVAYGYHSQLSSTKHREKWVQIKLQNAVQISRIVIHPCHDDYAGIGAGFGLPKRMSISIGRSDDELEVVWEGEGVVQGLQPIVIDLGASQQEAAFVRVSAEVLARRAKDFNFALAELEVFDSAGTNVALEAEVQALDSIESAPRWSKGNLIDGKWPRFKEPTVAEQLAELQRERNALWKEVNTPERQQRDVQIRQRISTAEAELRKLPEGLRVYAAATEFKPQGNFKPTRGKVRAVHVLRRGNVTEPMEPAEIGTVPLPEFEWRFSADLDESERRAQLAQWLTDERNPFAGRSIVNRVWQHHFGQGLVSTPNDFGRMGAQPSHPALLDWLALEFRRRGESLKELHRMIVTSNVYQQSSGRFAQEDPRAKIDSGNRFLWRMNRRRLSAEEIRDSILSASGVMDHEMGGPGFYLFELERPEHSPHFEYHKFDPANASTYRRSIYRFVVRSQPDPWMTCLDCADSSQSTPQRSETLTALQALSLLNSRFNLQMAKQFSLELQKEWSAERQVILAFRRLVQREPTEREKQQCVAYREKHGLENLCRILFNLSELIYLD